MGKQNHQFVQPAQIGTVKRIGEFLISSDGDLEELYMYTDYGPANNVTFDVKLNGVSIYAVPGDRFTMPGGTLGDPRAATQTTFSGNPSVPVNKGDKVIVSSAGLSAFDKIGPKVFMQLTVEDGEAVQGPTGATGATGATGPAGATGPTGISAFARTTVNHVTASLGNNVEGAESIATGKSSEVLKVVADRECRLRMYVTSAARTADSARPVGQAPANGHGLALEVVFTAGNLTAFLPSMARLANMEGSPTANIPSLVENLSGGTSTIALDFTLIPLEL